MPVIKVCVAGSDVEPGTVRSAREKGRPGRKTSAAKEEDEQLVKKIKLGEVVERNERQIKNLEEMNKGNAIIKEEAFHLDEEVSV